MIYQLLINHKLFKFIQIGNRTTLVVRSADAVELGAFGRVRALLRMEPLSMLVPLPISANITFPFGSTVMLITIRPSSWIV